MIHDNKILFRIPKGTINYTSLSARLWNIPNMKIYVHVPLHYHTLNEV